MTYKDFDKSSEYTLYLHKSYVFHENCMYQGTVKQTHIFYQYDEDSQKPTIYGIDDGDIYYSTVTPNYQLCAMKITKYAGCKWRGNTIEKLIPMEDKPVVLNPSTPPGGSNCLTEPSVRIAELTAKQTNVDYLSVPTKDSGQRATFNSGMMRDVEEDKLMFHAVMDGPMFGRWVALLTRGKKKYPDDPETGEANWTKANSIVEWLRFRKSLFRHFILYFIGCTDEDHGAAIIFNLNGAEYVDPLVSNEDKGRIYIKYQWLRMFVENK